MCREITAANEACERSPLVGSDQRSQQKRKQSVEGGEVCQSASQVASGKVERRGRSKQEKKSCSKSEKSRKNYAFRKVHVLIAFTKIKPIM